MSTEMTADITTELAPVDEHEHDHPTDRKYVTIALILGALTAVEIVMFVIEDTLGSTVVKLGLLILMAVKFWIVGSYFMHLKFDSKLLTFLFFFGLALAVVVYFIMLSAFEFNFWNDGYEDPGLPTPVS